MDVSRLRVNLKSWNFNICFTKLKNHIQIIIKMLKNSKKETKSSCKAPNEDLKDMDVFGTFKINFES